MADRHLRTLAAAKPSHWFRRSPPQLHEVRSGLQVEREMTRDSRLPCHTGPPAEIFLRTGDINQRQPYAPACREERVEMKVAQRACNARLWRHQSAENAASGTAHWHGRSCPLCGHLRLNIEGIAIACHQSRNGEHRADREVALRYCSPSCWHSDRRHH